jgi:hypothetical protein
MVSLPGASQSVHVISSPGTHLLPRWTLTTDLGTDPPAFHSAGEQR